MIIVRWQGGAQVVAVSLVALLCCTVHVASAAPAARRGHNPVRHAHVGTFSRPKPPPVATTVDTDVMDRGSGGTKPARPASPSESAARVRVADIPAAAGAPSRNDGGYDTRRVAAADSPFCNIDRAPPDMPAEDFQDLYENQRPLIFSSTSGPAWDASRARLSKASLLRVHGNRVVTSFNPEGYPFRGGREWTLRDYLGALPELRVHDGNVQSDELTYLFSDDVARDLPGVLEGHPAPPHLDRFFFPDAPDRVCFPSDFGIGAAGTGVPFHFHSHVVAAEVVFGSKRWLISRGPPGGGFNHKHTTLRWIEDQRHQVPDEVLGDVFWDCTLGPGEAIYVPGGFHHATVNVQDTVMITHTCMEDSEGEPEFFFDPDFDIQEALDQGLGGEEPLEDKYKYMKYFDGEGVLENRDGLVEAAVLYPREPLFALHLSIMNIAIARAMTDEDEGRHFATLGSRFATVAVSLNPLDPDAHVAAAECANMLDDYDLVEAEAAKAMELNRNELRVCHLAVMAHRERKQLRRADAVAADCEARARRVIAAKWNEDATENARRELSEVQATRAALPALGLDRLHSMAEL